MLSFLSTLSLRRATTCNISANCLCRDFYPRSPCGERLPVVPAELTTLVFLSTLSLRRATELLYHFCPVSDISIHALLAESDMAATMAALIRYIFLSTLSLRRATTIPQTSLVVIGTFLSTLSLRRATCLRPPRLGPLDISIHALLAESDLCLRPPRLGPLDISIHALLAESDGPDRQRAGSGEDFYPRSPCGERPI